jgi:hypothetical protein
VQERLESSDIGRALISAFLLVTLVVLFASNLPRLYDSELKRQLSRVGTPYLRVTGADQSWSVFAPEPVSQNQDFKAVVAFEDGSKATWRPPQRDHFIGAFRNGRWSKWTEVVRKDAYGSDVFESTARYVVRVYEKRGRRPVSVTFVRGWQQIPPPGSGQPLPPWSEEAYYEYRVPLDVVIE